MLWQNFCLCEYLNKKRKKNLPPVQQVQSNQFTNHLLPRGFHIFSTINTVTLPSVTFPILKLKTLKIINYLVKDATDQRRAYATLITDMWIVTCENQYSFCPIYVLQYDFYLIHFLFSICVYSFLLSHVSSYMPNRPLYAVFGPKDYYRPLCERK